MDRQVETAPLPDLPGVGAAGVDDMLAEVVTLLGGHPPFAIRRLADMGDAVLAHHLRARLSRAGGEGECGPGRIDVTVLRGPQRRLHPVEVVKRVAFANAGGIDDLHRMLEGGTDAGGVAQPVELVLGIGETQ